MQEVFYELDSARYALPTRRIGGLAEEAGLLATISVTLAHQTSEMSQLLGATLSDTPGIIDYMKRSEEATRRSSKHVGQAILLVGGEPNEKLMTALDATNAIVTDFEGSAQVYTGVEERLRTIVEHLVAIGLVVAEIADAAEDTQMRSIDAQQQHAAALQALSDYETVAGRNYS
jgi:hypothetical protein